MFFPTRSNIWVDLDLTVDPYDKKNFLIEMGRDLFFKAFQLCKGFHVNYRKESPIRSQLLTDTICKTKSNEILIWFKS